MSPEVGNIYCGSRRRGTYDNRPYGFPLDRPWNGFDRGAVVNNNDNTFGRVSKSITIFHAGVQTNPCNLAGTRSSRSANESIATPSKTPSTTSSKTPSTTSSTTSSGTSKEEHPGGNTTPGKPETSSQGKQEGSTSKPKLPQPETMEQAKKYC